MIIERVMDEIGAGLTSIAGLRVHAYEEKSVSPPAALVGLPNTIDFDKTYGRGMDEATLEVTLLVSEVGGARVARNAIAPYADGTGPMSVKQALERRNYTACDSVTVRSARFDVVTIAGTRYLAVIFTLYITGQGG
jgi:hypothetical protein